MLLVYRLWLIKLKSPKTEFMGRSCGFHVTHGESERAMEKINPKIMCGKHFWENMLVITALCSFLPLTLNFSLLDFFLWHKAAFSSFTTSFFQHYTSNRGYVRTKTLFCPSV